MAVYLSKKATTMVGPMGNRFSSTIAHCMHLLDQAVGCITA